MLSKAAMNDEHVDDFLNEISMISRVEDPSIIKVYASYEDHRLYYIVMDLYKGGDLFDGIIDRGNFTESDAINVA